MHLIPNSCGSLREHNDCHSKEDGKFCSDVGDYEKAASAAERALTALKAEVGRAGFAWGGNNRNRGVRMTKKRELLLSEMTGVRTHAMTGHSSPLLKMERWASVGVTYDHLRALAQQGRAVILSDRYRRPGSAYLKDR